MKKMLGMILATVLLFTSFGCVTSEASVRERVNNSSVKNAGKPVAIFYVPHQDDELLSMGVGILRHIEQGYNVHLVLYTDGENSNVLGKLGISKEKFGKARDKEFALSARALGVSSQNLHYKNLPDGSATVEDMKKIILEYNQKYPNAVHRGYSYYDKHNDHRVAGLALNELYNLKKINPDVKLYINYGRYDTKGVEERYSYRYKYKLDKASNAYNKNYPRIGFYGIGWKSARDLFVNFQKNQKSLYHLPNYYE